jgi:putative DNA methylase
VTMKAAIEYPLKFGPDLQVDIDRWVKWVGDEAERRLAEFFPSLPGESIQYYLWVHTIPCPTCSSVVPLSPTWWLSRVSNYAGKGEVRKITTDWYAVKPTPDLSSCQIGFDLIRGRKGQGTTIQTHNGDYDPNTLVTVGRGIGKCLNCNSVIENDYICSTSKDNKFGHQVYAIASKKGMDDFEFSMPRESDLASIKLAEEKLYSKLEIWEADGLIPHEATPTNPQYSMIRNYGIIEWYQCFNKRQLLTLLTHAEIINDAKKIIQSEYLPDRAEAIMTYLTFVFDRFIDKNSRLTNYDSPYRKIARATATHALNLMWNYPELNGAKYGWMFCAGSVADEYTKLCSLLSTSSVYAGIPGIDKCVPKSIQIDSASADSLSHIEDKSIYSIVTDPPYYATIPYADLSDFFYVWQKRLLSDVFPDLYWAELTDKDREAVANPSRFRGMGTPATETTEAITPEILANRDYEAKMAMAFTEYHRVLRDDGVMTVQFNHKDSGAWDVLAKSLIDSGFEITASWSVSTESPQNLHQAQKNSVSSTVLLVCRKRDPNAGQAWWDDLRPEVANLVEARAPEFEANEIDGIDLYLSAFGPALNVFSRNYPILASDGTEVRPEQAFAEARKAIANYRFRKLVQTDTAGFDPLTTWYILAWDAFRAREFPFDEARQLALAVGGFNVGELSKTYKLLDSTSGTCKLLTPQQRFKKRAFSLTDTEFSARHLVDGLHAIITLYLEEQSIDAVRRFMKSTGLVSNDMFMRSIEVALKVIPRIGDEKKRIPEEKALADLWLAMDEIKAKVTYIQPELELGDEQQTLDLGT